jgi:hypothetical protein
LSFKDFQGGSGIRKQKTSYLSTQNSIYNCKYEEKCDIRFNHTDYEWEHDKGKL